MQVVLKQSLVSKQTCDSTGCADNVSGVGSDVEADIMVLRLILVGHAGQNGIFSELKQVFVSDRCLSAAVWWSSS